MSCAPTRRAAKWSCTIDGYPAMAARSGLMKDHTWFSMDKLIHSLPVRILLVVLLTLAFSALVPLLFLYNRAILPTVLKWTSIAAVGVFAGLVSRLLLSERTALLRLLAALLALLASLLLLGLLYPGDVGARLPDRYQSGLNLAWLGQFALGSLLAFVTLQAWKVRVKPAGRKKKAAPERKRGATPGSKKPRPKGSTRTGRPVQSDRPSIAGIASCSSPARLPPGQGYPFSCRTPRLGPALVEPEPEAA